MTESKESSEPGYISVDCFPTERPILSPGATTGYYVLRWGNLRLFLTMTQLVELGEELHRCATDEIDRARSVPHPRNLRTATS